MRKITEISPARLRRLNDGYTTSTDGKWTVVTATNSATEVFRASRPELVNLVVEGITGQPAAA